ncbi:MAG: hypothetical protein A2293_07430 [Elusimicrobia bacterium RIFOXYB2_FULL_49_7]|nr:MAG: hypothetical protein A2293_07430 [Elusimicrobia bacterium RIFOXYB2_FULL_49_7]
MENEQFQEAIAQTVREVLETMTFIEVMPETPYLESAFRLENEWSALLPFFGADSGSLLLNCSSSFAKTATGALLGLEENEVAEGQAMDTVRELANMMAGGVFFRLDSEKSSVQLGIPRFFRREEVADLPISVAGVLICPFVFRSLSPEGEQEERVFIEFGRDTKV